MERPLSTVKDENPNTSRFLKATGRGSLVGSEIPKSAAPDEDYVPPNSEETEDEDILTDPDGWVYGDNKWENQSNRGVMGKVSISFREPVLFPVNLL